MDTQLPLNQSGHESETSHKVVRWLVRESMGTVMMAVILFLSAGRIEWVAGWALVIITALWVTATALVVIPRYPELLAERVGPKKGTKPWDTIILSIYGLVTLVRYIVAGLDVRFGWTTGISDSAQIVAFIIAAMGYGLVVWSTGTNAYFSQTARIQTERGHRVVTSGPYHFVRHPGYIGMILFELASAIMLGSWWALLLSGVSSVLFVVRTSFEDKMLQGELHGYTDYAQHTRYRLIPGIW
jgi:protein-S-isoprenylcysteine O-methyltransferase Ste14